MDVPSEDVRPATGQPQWRRYLFLAVAVPFTLFHVWVAWQGWPAPFERRVLHVGGGFALLFLLLPLGLADRPRLRAASTALDLAVAAFALVQAVYLVQSSDRLLTKTGLVDPLDAVFGVVTLVIVVEGTRRALGWGLALLATLALAYLFLGHLLPFAIGHGGYSLQRAISNLYLGVDGIFGGPTGASVNYVVIFLFFAVLLDRAGASAALSSLATWLFGRYRGGPAKVAVVGSSLYGTISGSAVANAASIGPISIPMMIRSGIHPRVAASIESIASVGGQYVPPVMGATAFVMAELLNVPFSVILAAAIVPAAVYYVATFLLVHCYAVAEDIPPVSADKVREARRELGRTWYRTLPLVLLLSLIGFAQLPADRAALYASLMSIGVALTLPAIRNRLIGTALDVCRVTSEMAVPVVAAVAAAGIVVGTLGLTGIGDRLASLLVGLSGGNLVVLLLLTMLAALVLGAGLPTLPTYILLVVLLAPALIELGVPPIAAHFFIFYYGVLADLTPPTAVTVVVSAGIARENPWRTMFTATRLGLFAYVIPLLFALYPAMLLHGEHDGGDVTLTILSTVVGIVAAVGATQGWLLTPLARWARLALLVPVALVLQQSLTLSAAAAALLAILVTVERVRASTRSGSQRKRGEHHHDEQRTHAEPQARGGDRAGRQPEGSPGRPRGGSAPPG